MQRLSTLLAGIAAIVVTSLSTANAVVIKDLGVNPNSAQGIFANDPNGAGVGGLFYDQYTFQLAGGPAFVTIASATNTFATGGITGPFGIQNFTGAVYQIVGGIDPAPGGDDILRFGPTSATLCASGLCQFFNASGVLGVGHYYLALAGNAGSLAGYGGDLSTSVSPVPIPAVGTGLPGIVGGVAGMLYWLKKRRQRRNEGLIA